VRPHASRQIAAATVLQAFAANSVAVSRVVAEVQYIASIVGDLPS
jgi:hypothetical protein